MTKYVQATSFRVKEGKLEAATEEIRRWVSGYRDIGCEVAMYVQVGAGDTGAVLTSVTFPDGETWLKSIEDPRMLEARARMTEPDWPFSEQGSTVWQELEISS